MRFFEIIGGFRVPVSGEESEILSLSDLAPLPEINMDERQQEVARLMVSRGLLRRHGKTGDMNYSPNYDPNLRRF